MHIALPYGEKKVIRNSGKNNQGQNAWFGENGIDPITFFVMVKATVDILNGSVA